MGTVPRVRFAPSPTGELHLGGARTALFNALYARQNGGKFFLRIEDTDVKRSRREHVDQIRESLEWLGLDWDRPTVFQSERKERHGEAVKTLLRSGKAYRCFCTVEDINRAREAARKERRPYRYPGTCRNLTGEDIRGKLNRAEPFCVRLRIPRGNVTFHDAVYGDIEVSNREIDDFIIQRTDGTSTYNLTVVVDDLDMGITTVIRGEDHLTNTPKQILVYRALGEEPPHFAHLPMILAPDGHRLSKRHGARGVLEYRDLGYLPQSLVNYLALLGWSPGDDREVFTWDELVTEFSLERIQKTGAIFDEKKLQWVSGQHMSMTSSRALLKAVRETVPGWRGEANERYVIEVIELLKSRVKTVRELDEFSGYFFEDPRTFDRRAVTRRWPSSEVNDLLRKYLSGVEQLETWDVPSLEAHLRKCAEEFEVPTGLLIHPVRIAVTGTGVGPPLFDLMALLGKEAVLRRIKFAIENLPSGAYIAP